MLDAMETLRVRVALRKLTVKMIIADYRVFSMCQALF